MGCEICGLAPGKYSVCVHSPSKRYLDPCLWGTRTTFEIDAKDSAKTQYSDVKLDLKRGTLIRFLVEDPDALLNPSSKSPSKARLGAGVWTPNGEYIPILPIQINSHLWIFEVAVPKKSGLHAAFRRTNVGINYLRDSKSAPELLFVDSPSGFGLMVPDSDSPQTYRFQVTKAK